MKRQEKSKARRKAILAAALQEFSANGFTAARMEDIARKAGVAKGTLYLYFTDKAGLFEGLVVEHLAPVHLCARDVLNDPTLPFTEKLLQLTAPLRKDNGFSPAGEVIRLLHSEGRHNPQLTETYLATMLGPILEVHREYMLSRTDLDVPDALRSFPQLLVGPLIHGIVWQGLFGISQPLDLDTMYIAYLDMILPSHKKTSSS